MNLVEAKNFLRWNFVILVPTSEVYTSPRCDTSTAAAATKIRIEKVEEEGTSTTTWSIFRPVLLW